jgi:hypothetical protein
MILELVMSILLPVILRLYISHFSVCFFNETSLSSCWALVDAVRAVGSEGNKSLIRKGRFEEGGMQHLVEVDFLVHNCIFSSGSLKLDTP